MRILKNHGLFGRLTAAVLCCLVLGLSLLTAGAEDVGTLTISYPLEDTQYHIYRVGSLKNGGIVMDDAFSKVDTSDYAAAASVMGDMVRAGAATELANAKVTNGKAVFRNLSIGVYLVIGDPGELNGIQYWPTPLLVSVPQKDENGSFLWDVSAEGKKEMDMDISVVKRWVGDQASARPASVTVHLMRNGNAYGSPVTLSSANQWSHMWENLPPDNWYVTEDANPRYTSAIPREGNTFIVTNTWKKIPQTGPLWWPVSVLAFSGLVFLCLGLLRRRTSDENG